MSGSPEGDEAGEPPTLTIPRGTLLRSRVVSDVGTTLSRALDRGLTGYATLVPQETLLLSGEAKGVLTFEDGVPVLAYNTVTDSGGPDALAELAVPGPYRVELYAVDPSGLAAAHGEEALRVAPDAAATELADDAALADRTREAAPADRLRDDADEDDAVAAFLADDDRIDAIREQARSEARDRAAEWGLDDALDDPSEPDGSDAAAATGTTERATDEPDGDDRLRDSGDHTPPLDRDSSG
ncbi:hypothetical protein C464_13765 [Halorubrum coriense DSM 10284]|uniref:DUF8054 domain-containing protein n=1 Tax=Halorubrum coriense DSM 10284 TaxID=1227466 RepID=M0EC62_9EURY|nr:hypothetical protein [Halorubrum coriense]ELZ44462.1 hypothetical protein C464_13765 [Halorubrum coriense DSM 10284]